MREPHRFNITSRADVLGLERYYSIHRISEVRFVDARKEKAIHLNCGVFLRVIGLYRAKSRRDRSYVRLWCRVCEVEIGLTVSNFACMRG